MLRAALIAPLSILLAGCENDLPSASKEQVESFLSECGVTNANIVEGTQATSDWVIDFDSVTQSDWDCLSDKSNEAGVLVSKLANTVIESE